MTTQIKLVVAVVVGFAIGLMMNFGGETAHPTERMTTSKTVLIPHTKTDTIQIVKPVVRYISEPVQFTKTDTIISKFKPYDYTYTYKNSILTDDKKIKIDLFINGWGGLEDMNYKVTNFDTLKETVTTETVTKTKIVNPSGLYLSAIYSTDKSIGAGLDMIKNRVIIGTQVQYDPITQKPSLSAKFGLKLN